jgi:hypothetical protein
MKATEAKLPDFLKKSPQFVIPIDQRTWSWTEPQCRQWRGDSLHTGQGLHLADHKAFNWPGAATTISRGGFRQVQKNRENYAWECLNV